MDQLAARIAKVEHEVVRCRRRARRAEVGLAAVVIGLLAIGMASKGTPKEIVATSFKLVSTGGDVLAVLGPNQYSQSGLHFYQTNNDQDAVASYSGYGVQLAGKEQNSHLTHSELVITAERSQVMLRAVSLKNRYGGVRCGNSPPPPRYEGGVAWLDLRGDSKNRAVLMAHTNGTTTLTLSARDKGTIAIDHAADSTDRDWDRVWEAVPVEPAANGN